MPLGRPGIDPGQVRERERERERILALDGGKAVGWGWQTNEREEVGSGILRLISRVKGQRHHFAMPPAFLRHRKIPNRDR